MAVPTGVVCHTTQGTVGTTATALGTVLCDWFRVEAAPGNTGKIYVGGSNVTSGSGSTGYFVCLAAGTTGLNAGYEMKSPGAYDNARGVMGKVFDLSKFYVIGSAASQIYNITYFERMNDG